MTAALALIGASWRHAVSYKMSMAISLIGLVASVVPIYFVASALDPVMANAIREEGHQYFGFLLVGMVAVSFVPVAAQSFPSSVSSGIGSGILEAVLGTPTSVPAIVVGMTGYGVLWATIRGVLMIGAGFLMGAAVSWLHLPAALLILGLIVLAYLPVGLLGAAMILLFRTMGPLMPAVLIVSSLLGGVYYPTHVIPSWLAGVSAFVPLTYGLRALRRVLLDGASLREVGPDLGVLLFLSAVLFVLGSLALQYALRYARRAGTLGHY
jgi:ABC-2 type transport system permease protein